MKTRECAYYADEDVIESPFLTYVLDKSHLKEEPETEHARQIYIILYLSKRRRNLELVQILAGNFSPPSAFCSVSCEPGCAGRVPSQYPINPVGSSNSILAAIQFVECAAMPSWSPVAHVCRQTSRELRIVAFTLMIVNWFFLESIGLLTFAYAISLGPPRK
jgi:hypothetical protein